MHRRYLALALLAAACAMRPVQTASPGYRPTGPLVIRNARVFDPETRTVREGMIVIIEGDRILGVEHDANVVPPPNAEIIDAGGRMLLPGNFGPIEAGALADLILVDGD